MEKISELVWLYVKRRPFLKEVLREKTVNYSALARKISYGLFGNEKQTNAIKAALQRISSKLEKQEKGLEETVLKVLKESSIHVMSKIAVVISSKEIENVKPLSYVQSRNFTTYILRDSELEKIKKSKAIWKIEKTMNLITIQSTEDIEETPGVISMILNSLASEGINVVEFISCYTDTLLVVKESDTSKAYEILSSLTRS